MFLRACERAESAPYKRDGLYKLVHENEMRLFAINMDPIPPIDVQPTPQRQEPPHNHVVREQHQHDIVVREHHRNVKYYSQLAIVALLLLLVLGNFIRSLFAPSGAHSEANDNIQNALRALQAFAQMPLAGAHPLEQPIAQALVWDNTTSS